MSSNKVTRKGPGIGKYIKRVKKPGTVDVGIIDAGIHDDSLETVATIAFKNEFGDTYTPERSFMRSTIHEKKKEIVAMQVKLWKQVTTGKINKETALGLLGEFIADLIKLKIVAIKDPPNAQRTIDAKGTSNPLIETKQMHNSITYEVNR